MARVRDPHKKYVARAPLAERAQMWTDEVAAGHEFAAGYQAKLARRRESEARLAQLDAFMAEHRHDFADKLDGGILASVASQRASSASSAGLSPRLARSRWPLSPTA